MKKSVMIGIVIILLLIVGIYLLSPISPLNKVSVDGKGLDMPKGYKVVNSSESYVTISNGTNNISILPIENSNDLNETLKAYHKKHKDNYNISTKKLNTTNNEEVYRTVAKSNKTTVITYWFNDHKNNTYKVRTDNAVKGTEDVVLKIISSMS